MIFRPLSGLVGDVRMPTAQFRAWRDVQSRHPSLEPGMQTLFSSRMHPKFHRCPISVILYTPSIPYKSNGVAHDQPGLRHSVAERLGPKCGRNAGGNWRALSHAATRRRTWKPTVRYVGRSQDRLSEASRGAEGRIKGSFVRRPRSLEGPNILGP